MLRLAIFAFLVASITAGPIKWEDCGSLGEIVSIDIEDCTDHPCVLNKGRNYAIEVLFRPKFDSSSAILTLVGKVSIITVPILEKDACEGLSTGCPYKGGELISQRSVINISHELIETDARVEYRLKNSAGQVEICFAVPVRIAPPSSV
jgi:hypothetical protein